jgi:hypothetical protein
MIRQRCRQSQGVAVLRVSVQDNERLNGQIATQARNLDCHLGGTSERGSCPSFLLIKFIAASYNLVRI